MLLSIPRAMTVVASADEGDGQDARGVDYVPDSFDASEDEDNGVEVESARGEARIRGVNYVPDSINASEDDDKGVLEKMKSVFACAWLFIEQGLAAQRYSFSLFKISFGGKILWRKGHADFGWFSSRARKVAPSCFIRSKITEGN
jgi:hypothetical protein